MENKQLRKSAENEVIDGVCGGLGEYFGVDPVLVRAVFVVGTIAGVGSFILVYIILMILMPEAGAAPKNDKPKRTVEVPKDDKLHVAKPFDDYDEFKGKVKPN
jgi:phage shock protein PspC (stress-responsive transcriptional regulator)